jgi:hypothetical protein
MRIPIVNADRKVVGWTHDPPVIEHNRLRHPVAERLLGGPIFCTEVTLDDPRHAVAAGAPRGWRHTWRCMAICGDERSPSFERMRRLLPAEAETKSAAGPRRGGADSSSRKAG